MTMERESWFLSVIFFLLSVFLWRSNRRMRKKPSLPPGPPCIPLLGNLLWLSQIPSMANLELLLRRLRRQFGPIITLRIGFHPSIFITHRSLAHKALVLLGPSLSSRPPMNPTSVFFESRISSISASPYGRQWRLLRLNLASEILHPSKIPLFSAARRWAIRLLLRDLRAKSPIEPMEAFQVSIFSLLLLMCFGEKHGEEAVRPILSAQRDLLLFSSTKLSSLAVFPELLSSLLFRRRIRALDRLRQRQLQHLLPLIRSKGRSRTPSYLDALLGIRLGEGEEGRLRDTELAALCSEFLMAGTDTTATALEWTMAEVAALPTVQARLLEELEGGSSRGCQEEDLQRMPYLKALVLEGLRRHPPAHFLLPHSAAEGDIELEGFLIPKGVPVNFTVASFGLDEEVWREPTEFRPERFEEGELDITGTREIKMMPFWAGRRMCPGLGLAMLHLELFVANLVREFEWAAVDGEEIDFSERHGITVGMKQPLRVRMTPRKKM